jgi:hypothetical protein
MKKLAIALLIALIATAVIAIPAMAWGGGCGDQDDASASVDCGEINVTDDSPAVGTTITFSGTVDITSSASKKSISAYAYASSNAWYEIYDPDGTLIFSENQDFDDCDWTLFGRASADASQTYNWSQDVYVVLVGDYIAQHGGEAYAENGWQILWWQITDDSASASCSIQRTVTSHSGVVASTSYIHPYLVIGLPDGSKHFFSNDGWGNPTSQDIVYTDGTWQVEIPDGTGIQLDGAWHRTTYLEVDDQGNVTGRYNAGGSTTATDIGLSQPMTITKVG